MQAEQRRLIEDGIRLGVHNPDRKLCLVIGCSPNAQNQFDDFKKEYPDIPFDVISINRSIEWIEHIDHWCTMHPYTVFGHKHLREVALLNMDFKTHTPLRNNLFDEKRWGFKHDVYISYIDYLWKKFIITGSSSLFGVGCAMGMGYKGVILCGVELSEARTHFAGGFMSFGIKYPDYAKTMGCLRKVQKRLGKPTKQWIDNLLK